MKRNRSNIIVRLLFSPKLFALGLLAIVIALSIPISKNISKRYVVDQEIIDLQAEIMEMEASNKNFKKIIDYLESDQFVEEQARLSMGLKKPGEEVVIIKSSGLVAGASELRAETGSDEKEDPNYVRWWKYFFQSGKRIK